MSINPTVAPSRQEIFDSLNPAESSRGSGKAQTVEDMGSEDFLALMVAQLENQDPTKPMDNLAMMNQLAQFGTVGGIQELNEAFSDLTGTLTGSSAMQAASMVGRAVATDSNVGTLQPLGADADGEVVYGMAASVEMGPNSQGGVFYVQDQAGQLVYSGPIPSGGGTQLIQWDGKSSDGEQLPQGVYRISADNFYGGQQTPVPAYVLEQIQSVSVGSSNDVTLNLSNGQTVRVDEVKEFF